MTPKHWLLGFDLRACSKDYVSREWHPERRATYLLKTDVEWPLSVDTAVWPSLFHFTSRLQNYRPVETVDVEPSSDRQLILRLWDDVAGMEAMVRTRMQHDMCFVRVAIELCQDGTILGEGPWDLVMQSPQNGRAATDWRSIGFDVADADFVSGLMNCGYKEEELAKLSEWSQDLNEFGLFGDMGRASEFRRLANERVPEHAPFFVYRLLADLNVST